MKKPFFLEELKLSGDRCQILSIKFENEDITEFEKFLINNEEKYSKQINSIVTRLSLMKSRNGCSDIYFEKEVSSPYDSICRLNNTKKIRLYSIRFGNIALILGGGGFKPDSARTYQEVPELNSAVETLQAVYSEIEKKLLNKEINLSHSGFPKNLFFE